MPRVALGNNAHQWRKGTCRGCGAPIIWATTLAGRSMPLNEGAQMDEAFTVDSGSTHWATCPQRARFQRPKVQA